MVQLQGKEEIINMALDWLKDAPIMSVEDGTSRADFMKRNYDTIRDSTVRSVKPNFAGHYWMLPRDPDAPTSTYNHQYALPKDMIRLAPLRQNGDKRAPRIPYEVVGNFIHTDASQNPLRVFGWKQVTNEGQFSANFVSLFALNLALKAAHFITGKSSYADRLLAIRDDAASDATMVELQENPYGNPVQDINDMRADRAFAHTGRSTRYFR